MGARGALGWARGARPGGHVGCDRVGAWGTTGRACGILGAESAGHRVLGTWGAGIRARRGRQMRGRMGAKEGSAGTPERGTQGAGARLAWAPERGSHGRPSEERMGADAGRVGGVGVGNTGGCALGGKGSAMTVLSSGGGGPRRRQRRRSCGGWRAATARGRAAIAREVAAWAAAFATASS